MNSPKKHHFVPKIYLQQFSYNEVGDLWTYKPNAKYPSKIRTQNKTAVCYYENLYKLDNERHSDDLIIETKKFWYEKTFLKNITSKINKLEPLDNNEYIDLLKMILSIKNRNLIHFNQFFQSPQTKLNLDASIEELSLKLTQQAKTEDNEIFINDLFKKVKDVVLENLKVQSNSNMILNESLLNIFDDKNPKFNLLLGWISSKKSKIVFTEGQNSFITCDNPGHTIHKNGLVGNLLFGSAEALFFPLSPKCALFIDLNGDMLSNYNHQILPKYEKIEKHFVNMFNKGTITNCNELIISHCEKVLYEFVKPNENKKGPELTSRA